MGAFLKLDLVWALSDVFNGLMALPNLIALLLLSPVLAQVTREYFSTGADLIAIGSDTLSGDASPDPDHP